MVRVRKRIFWKRCTDCGKRFRAKSKRVRLCSTCRKEHKKASMKKANRKFQSTEAYREHKKAYMKKYNEKNADKIREYNKVYYMNNSDICYERNKRSMYNRLVKLADTYNSFDELSENDKKFVLSHRDCGRLIQTGLQYGRLKHNKTGYERHHIIPYKTAIHYWELTGDEYYLDLTWKDENIVQLTPEAHSKLHAKLYEFGYGREAIVPEENWEEYKELVFNIIEDKNQTTLFDF